MNKEAMTDASMLHAKSMDSMPGQEIVNKRTQFSKVFSLGGNRFQAVTYTEPVHKYNKATGQWDEIDATFRQSRTAMGSLPVMTANGATFAVACETSGEKPFIHFADNNGHEISWGIMGAANVDPVAAKLPETAKFTNVRDLRERVMDQLHHQLTYRDIFPGADLVCHTGSSFKDELVFNSIESVRPVIYRFQAAGLSFAIDQEQVITVNDQNGKTVFSFPAPFMVDAEGNHGKVMVDLRETEEGYFMLCEPEKSFVENALYPITLDPAIRTEQDSTSIVDTYVRENYTADYSTSADLWITNNTSYGKRNSYLRVTTLPTLSSSSFITGATLFVRPAAAPTAEDGSLLLAKEVLGPWVPSTITYANQPALSDVYQDSWIMPKGKYNWCEIDVTALARKWYLGENYGVALVHSPNSVPAIRLQSMSGSTKPYFVVNYSSLAGLEDYLSYDVSSAGRAGVGYVSLHNGNLVFAHADTEMNGNKLPVSITHFYNSCDAKANQYNMGYGWKTSLHQTLHKEYLNSKVYYVYTDGDGTQHYFESANTSNTEYKDMSGLSLKLVPGSGSSSTTITDKGDNVMAFPNITTTPTASSPVTTAVLISKINDACGNQITISATGMKINSVTDGANRVTTFNYNASGLCTSIVTPWQTSSTGIRFTYNASSQLTSVTYEDNTSSSFTYSVNDGFALLTSATAADGTKITYTYTNTGAVSGLPHCITRAKTTAANNSQTISDRNYNYGHLMTKVIDNLTNHAIRYHFNENGNQISIDDGLGYARYTQYDQSGDNANTPINHPTLRSRMQRVVNNLLVDGIVDNSSAWVTGGTGTFSRDQTTFQWGVVSRKIVITAGKEAYVRQTVNLTAGKSYTFSGYIKSTAPKAFLRISYTLNGSTVNVDSDPVSVGASSFQRMAVSFTLPVGASSSVICSMMCTTNAGSAWFDCMQLEEGLTMNHFNMLQNSNFASGSGTLPTSWATSYTSTTTFAQTVSLQNNPPAFLTGRAVRVSGLYYANIDVYQQFRCSGHAGDRFSAGGWCRGYAKRSRENNTAACRIRVLFSVNNSTWVGGGSIEWNSTEGEWQFASGSAIAPFNYSYVRLAIEYVRQINHSDFTGLYLYPEQFGAEYVYDAKGNRQSVTTLFGKPSASRHDDFNNLISYTAPGHSNASTYNYGSTDAEKKKHLLLKSVSPLGTVTTATYDAFGNPLTSQVKDADTATAKFMQTETTYANNGNYVATQKDARGKVVTTVTDGNKGTVTSVTDPNNQAVNYTYDTLRRVTQTSATVSGGTVKNEYVYHATTGNLMQVKHNTTTDTSDVVYNFTYDAQNRPVDVKVGSQTLSTNEYNNNSSSVNYGTLQKVTYGNNQYVENTYDDFNRIIAVKFSGESTPRFQYAYNADGQVAHVTDTVLNRKLQSEYDLADRPCRVKLHENGNHLYTGEVEYDPVKGNLSRFVEKVGTGYTAYETTFGYDEEDRPTTLNYGSTTNQTTTTFDRLGRATNRTVKVGGTAYSTTYGYVAGGYGSNSTTPLVSSITQNGQNFAYTYDNVGNIATVTHNGKLTSYTYDTLGQLIRVNDQDDTTSGSTGTTWVYTYDRGGNILNKKRYAYTTGTVGTALETITYTYGDSNWKDKLTAFNGTAITYDGMGNPLTDGTWTYTWQYGRQLKRMTKTGETLEFKYNADGLRVEKIATSTGTTKYTLHGKNIVHMTNGSNVLHFWYDAQNRPAIVEYNGSKYAYVYNLQGDVMSIIDTTGTAVVYYKYDAWGKPISKTGTMAATLGTLNPFRYRGYVFDEETELFYLRSRYSNPMLCRFVSADDNVENGTGYIGCNQYTYCINNPVVRKDESGTESLAAPVWDFISQEGAQFAMADGMLPICDSLVVGAFIVACSLSLVDICIDTYNSVVSSSVSVPTLSKEINWGTGDKNHILNGSKNHGGHDWSPFGIGPNDPKGWEKLLPLLKIVADHGQQWNNPYQTKPIPYVEYYSYYFDQYSYSIVLKLFNIGGQYSVSDAYPFP